MGKREQERRTSAGRRWADNSQGGYETSTIKMPDGLSFFNPEKGMTSLDIVPYHAGPGNPWADEGELYFERTFYTYRAIGPEEKQVVCPSKTFGKPDYVQDFRQKESRKPEHDSEYLKTLVPKHRQIWLVRPHTKDSSDQLFLWEVSFHNFGKLLATRIRNSPEERGWDRFYLPDEDGFTLEITFSEASMGANKFIEASAIDFIPRKKPLPPAIRDHGFCLDNMLIELGYDELRNLFHGAPAETEKGEGTDSRREPERPDRREPEPEARRRREPEPEPEPRLRRDAHFTVDLNQVGREPEPEPESKLLTAMAAGISRDDYVRFKGENCLVIRISPDGTSLTLEDENEDIIKAVGIDEVEPMKRGGGVAHVQEDAPPFVKDAEPEYDAKPPAKEKPAEAASDFNDDWD